MLKSAAGNKWGCVKVSAGGGGARGLCKMKRKVHISKTLFILTIVQSGPRET